MMEPVRGTASFAFSLLLLVALVHAQGTPPGTPLTLVSRDGRRPLATTVVSGQEMIALEELVPIFQIAVREDALAGGLTVTARGQSIVMSPGQPTALVRGRVVTLPAAPARSGNRWLVPLDFLPRALALLLETRIELRRPSRLVIVGDIQVPRVAARIDAAGPPTRATIEITPAAPVTVTTEAGRIVARIEADALDFGAVDGAGLIDAIRAGDQPRTVTILLDSRAGTARAVPSEAGGVTRIAVEVAAAAAPAPASGAPAGAPPAATPPAPPPATLPFLAATRPLLQAIVIDPGHGGDDTGARGANGTQEKDITLQVARRVRTLIEMRLGIRVILTRDDDRPVSLDTRSAVANNSKADLFLSLHANAAPVADMAGAEVFHLRLDREGEDARRSAEADAVSLPVLGGATRTIDVMRWDLAQVRHIDASAALAAVLEEQLRAAQIPMAPQPLRQGPLRVLTSVNMPAALVEIGYLTNAAQETQLASEPFQASVAQSIYNAVLRFRTYLEEHRGQ